VVVILRALAFFGGEIEVVADRQADDATEKRERRTQESAEDAAHDCTQKSIAVMAEPAKGEHLGGLAAIM
jgi:hypothetical protein